MRDLTIAFDLMSSDKGYQEGVRAVELALKEFNCKLLLTHTENKKKGLEAKFGKEPRVELQESEHQISHKEKPQEVLEKKINNTITNAVKAVGEGKAQAIVSPGNTGVLIGSAEKYVGRIALVKQAPLVAKIVALKGIYPYGGDMGAYPIARNTDLETYTLLLNAYLNVMGEKSSRIGIINIGDGENKGRRQERLARKHLDEWSTKGSLNFHGFIEPSDIKKGKVQGFISDGYTTNLFLKTIEAYAKFYPEAATDRIPKNWKITKKIIGYISALSGMIFNPRLITMLDRKNYPGAILLGYKAPIIKAHGDSEAEVQLAAIKTALDFAKKIKKFNEIAEYGLREYKKFISG